MASSPFLELSGRSSRRQGSLIFLVALVLVLLLSARYIASTVLDYAWWTELGQRATWLKLLLYSTAPAALATLLFFALFFSAFRLGLRRASRTQIVDFLSQPLWLRIAGFALFLLAVLAARATVDDWTLVRYLGSLGLRASPGDYVDPIFQKHLGFYLFDLPFYSMALSIVLVAAVLTLVIFSLVSNVENLRKRMPSIGPTISFEFERLSLGSLLDSGFVRGMISLFLLGLATHYFLARYGMLQDDHGSFLTGIDWVEDHIVLPLQWTLVVASIAAAVLVLLHKSRMALLLLLLLPVRWFLPSVISAFYVRPNELALEKPYIEHHLKATRSAFALDHRVRETRLEASSETRIDYDRHRATLDNVRLWDWRAFHDTVSQIQPLRPYIYADTDVDRYQIDGQMRQVLLAPRELDIRQLGEARNRWINPHLIYTHGYGIVLAEANRITPDGLPALFIEDAPPVVNTKSLRFTQPEIYFSEVAHEPVFVDTKQKEFNYPAGSQESVETTYKGTGGFPLTWANRLAAAIEYGDLNTLITGYLSDRSRIMIRRAIRERLSTLAGFVSWDADPYLVVTAKGGLVWIVDGYLHSDAHPYSRLTELPDGTAVNYIRNSVKATVDAYSGQTTLYVFDQADVLLAAYRQLLPSLFHDAKEMPPDLRAHVRYPETLFSVQAEMYRSFHMRDAESFYNRADLWDLARTGTRSDDSNAGFVQPTFVVASLPGEPKAEFMLTTTFTPANKNNLIGFMAARCDGEHLGELVFEQLAKQSIVFGPLQIDGRINQDQTISKDLTLWGQQGSQVLRGQTLVLPVGNSFLYASPIYIQASQGSMPQLRKVALAMGNLLAYQDTYEQALMQLIQASGGSGGPVVETPASKQTSSSGVLTTSAASPGSPAPNASAPTPAIQNPQEKLARIREHLERYRQLSAQGKWGEAGRELDGIGSLLNQ